MAKVDVSPGPENAAAAYLRSLDLPLAPPDAYTLDQVIEAAKEDYPHLRKASQESLRQFFGRQLRRDYEAGALRRVRVGHTFFYWPADVKARG